MKNITIHSVEELNNYNFQNLEINEETNVEIKLRLVDTEINCPINIYHNTPDQHSKINIKLALFGKSKVKMPVEIHVKKGAIDTATNFSALVYILSNSAQASVTPGLFIEEKNIQSASHGVIIKNIKDSDLHYLRSRGLNKESAKEMVIGIKN